MSKDRLAQIIGAGSRARAAFDALPEPQRIARVLASGAVPLDCGDAIPVAPARGAVRTQIPMAMQPKGADGWDMAPSGYRSRKGLIRADVFDRMREHSLRKGKVCLLTETQVAMGRTYRDLIERLEAGAIRCSSVEAMPGGGGGSADAFTDARLDAARHIDLLQARVGSGSALVVRRIRPSVRGSRRSIMDRDLVDMVAVGDLGLTDVLESHGWTVNGDIKVALARALAEALSRMCGPASGPGMQAAQMGAAGPALWP